MCSLYVTGSWGEQRPGELEHGLNERKTALKMSHCHHTAWRNFHLLSTSFIFISHGMHCVLKLSKSLLNFTHFWNKIIWLWVERYKARGCFVCRTSSCQGFAALLELGVKPWRPNQNLWSRCGSDVLDYFRNYLHLQSPSSPKCSHSLSEF